MRRLALILLVPLILLGLPLLLLYLAGDDGRTGIYAALVYAPRYRQEAIAYPHGHDAEHGDQLTPHRLAGDFVDQETQRMASAALCAGIAGARLDSEARVRLQDIPVCGSAAEIGCVNAWNAIGRQARDRVEPRDGEACVNPITWRADEAHAPKEINLGTIGGRFWGSGPIQFDSGLVDAQCERGWLWVTPPEGRWFWQPGPGDYHIQNYTFYFANIRDDDLWVALPIAGGADSPPVAGVQRSFFSPHNCSSAARQ